MCKNLNESIDSNEFSFNVYLFLPNLYIITLNNSTNRELNNYQWYPEQPQC